MKSNLVSTRVILSLMETYNLAHVTQHAITPSKLAAGMYKFSSVTGWLDLIDSSASKINPKTLGRFKPANNAELTFRK